MIEFERRFLIDAKHMNRILSLSERIKIISQGYVCSDDTSVVRIRKAHTLLTPPEWFITIKSGTSEAGKNYEFEYAIADGSDLFDRIEKKISKNRYEIFFGHLIIEVDVFYGRHEGLIIAEVELSGEADSEFLTNNLPDWFGEEITGKTEYSNFYLCTQT